MPAAFGSSVIEVAIGLTLMYLLLSLVVTVINELIAQLVALRANTLEQGLVQLLQGDVDASAWSFLRRVPFFTSVARRPTNPNEADRIRDTAATLLNHKLIVGISPPGQLPSYIPSRQFSLALLDILAPDLDPSRADYVRKLRDKLEEASFPNAHLKDALLSLLDETTRDAQDVRARIESWFNDSMDRVSGWYKRKATLLGLIVGLILTVFVNADSLNVAHTLWTNPDMRSAVVAAAQDYVNKQPTPAPAPAPTTGVPAGATPTPGPLARQGQALSNDIDTIEASHLPIGWVTFPPVNWLSALLGWGVTTLAISLGAPFWFDMLSTFVHVKTTGPFDKESTTTPSPALNGGTPATVPQSSTQAPSTPAADAAPSRETSAAPPPADVDPARQ